MAKNVVFIILIHSVTANICTVVQTFLLTNNPCYGNLHNIPIFLRRPNKIVELLQSSESATHCWRRKQMQTFIGSKAAELRKDTQNNCTGTPKNFSTFCSPNVVFVSKSLNLPLPFCSPDYPKIDKMKKKERCVKTHLTDCNRVSSTAESRIRNTGTNMD